jgi:ketosteroid isomerase-like protein
MIALWTDDGVLLAPGHGPISGKTKLREFYQAQQDALGEAEILSYEEQWQEVRIVGEYAYQWGQIHSRTRSGQGKAENSTALNTLRVLKREPDGGWRIFRAIYNEAHAGTSIGSETIPEGERR